MSLKEIWKDKVDGVDDVLAEDINAIARQAILNEESIESVSNRVDVLNDDMTANTASINRRIDNLEGMLIKYTEDSTEAYIKSVPTNSAHKAILNRVGGKTIQKGSKNICTDAVEGGIPIKFRGTYVAYKRTLPKGTYWISTKFEKEQGGEYDFYNIVYFGAQELLNTNPVTIETEAEYRCELNCDSGGGEITGRLYPMIIEYTEGTEIPTEYEPYEAPSLEPTKVTEIVSVGNNLFDTNNIIQGSFYASGEYMASRFLLRTANPISVIGGETYTVSCHSSYDLRYLYFYDKNNVYVSDIWMNRPTSHYYTFTVPSEAMFVHIGFENDGANSQFIADISAAQINSKMQLEHGSVKTEYSPYRRNSYPIPEEIQNKEGYGCGVGDVCNYIDYARKVYVQNVKVIDLGSLDWTATHSAKEGYRRYIAEFSQVKPPINDTAIANILCSKYNTITSTDVYLANEGIAISASGKVCIFDSILSSDTLSNFKEAIQGVMMCYELTEPIETDISDDILTDYPDYKFIEVHGGGELIAENKNKNKNPVPWTVTFAEV